ncbi:MAG TPA: heavy metal-binding domain-containing protein, partial [Gaiellaceae bacterium]|nr:heavy metal-binding domain-containing protein [Gaiellaceae bacterium]
MPRPPERAVEAKPGVYRQAQPPPPSSGPVAVRGEHACATHPEVVRPGPGTCPRCGMALEPTAASAGEEPVAGAELAAMTRRLVVAVAFTGPLLLVAWSDVVPGDPAGRAVRAERLGWIELALAVPPVLWGGWPLFVRAARSVARRSLDMFTLIALGTSAAFLFSVAATFAPAAIPPSTRTHGGAVPVYFEAAAVITTLVLLGQVLELRARG